ncbi:hypothetical protein VN12_26555 [Pirellula sp. SH-Sr6A]|uniref:hypothetical protein n=1 Tax=Pirellula sp. SH-Sr6A TaxID=1632865 RepID=UPI00078C8AD4|nr:hypothetical protein [Pirellula sp. SH-Sr6A]AMV35682.1 hypothetical protein VN12_26555 [Pirellula sp. SH-Sr6A]
MQLNDLSRPVAEIELLELSRNLNEHDFEILSRLSQERDQLRMVCQHLTMRDRTPREEDRLLESWASGGISGGDSERLLIALANSYCGGKSEVESFLSEDEIAALQDSKLHRRTPFLIQGVSSGFFSVARHTGAIRLNGDEYTYQPDTDELVRDDVLRFVSQRRIDLKKETKPGNTESQWQRLELGLDD